MHPRYRTAAGLTEHVISAAIEVHRYFGPGLLESIYEWALIRELVSRGYRVKQQDEVVVRYKEFERREILKFDLLVEDALLVEIKAVEAVHPRHKAQLISYMKFLDITLGLLINFHELKLVDGVSRLVLPGANSE